MTWDGAQFVAAGSVNRPGLPEQTVVASSRDGLTWTTGARTAGRNPIVFRTPGGIRMVRWSSADNLDGVFVDATGRLTSSTNLLDVETVHPAYVPALGATFVLFRHYAHSVHFSGVLGVIHFAA